MISPHQRVIATGPQYDPDAMDYFSRAESLGGSFDLSSINPTYTALYVKNAINNFVQGCKADGTWLKIIEAYLLAGVTFSGVRAKLKRAGTATLTTVNFVSGDFSPAGIGAGLSGNGTNKRVDTGLLGSGVNEDDLSWGSYMTSVGSIGRTVMVWNVNGYQIYRSGSHTIHIGGTLLMANMSSPGFYAATKRSDTNGQAYFNGTSVATSASVPGAISGQLSLFAQNNNGFASDCRQAFAFAGTALTDTDAANLSTRVNALMTAIGANVY